jgi:hypothetical protein
VTVGGVRGAFRRLGQVSYASSGDVTLFGLANPPTGAATFKVNVNWTAVLCSAWRRQHHWRSATSRPRPQPVANQALNSNASLSTSFSSSQFVVNAIGTFGTANSNVGLTSYNRTQRYHAGNFNGGSQFNMDLVAGTVSGVTNPSFTATVATTTNEGFAAVALALNPPPTIMGSYARAYRNATTLSAQGSGIAYSPTLPSTQKSRPATSPLT